MMRIKRGAHKCANRRTCVCSECARRQVDCKMITAERVAEQLQLVDGDNSPLDQCGEAANSRALAIATELLNATAAGRVSLRRRAGGAHLARLELA